MGRGQLQLYNHRICPVTEEYAPPPPQLDTSTDFKDQGRVSNSLSKSCASSKYAGGWKENREGKGTNENLLKV